MNHRSLLPWLFAATVMALTGEVRALNYFESVSGDLSNDQLAPTPLTFAVGENRVDGSMGGDPGGGIPLDRDFFSFTIAPGQVLTSIYFNRFTPAGASFYAIAAGTSIDINSPDLHLSNLLIKETGEILDDLSSGSYNGGVGLQNPLGPGTYTVWFQELSSVVSYDVSYTVSETAPVPEAGPMLAASGLILLGLAHRKLRKAAA